MGNEKNLLYLTVLVRALRRFSKAAGDTNALSDLDDLTRPAEERHLSLIERAEALSMGDLDYPSSGYHISEGGLQSILEEISNDNNTPEYQQPIVPVSFDEGFFAVKSQVQGDIKALWEKAKENVGNLQRDDINVLAENILNILFRFAVAVPSSGKTRDVSLYDQAHTAAAIAVCLYDSKTSGEACAEDFRLIGGDFSGIQKFIYQIVSKYAGKNLKGRSFYLGLLADAVVRRLLKELHLYRANIIYNSGGCFYILAPNTAFIREQLAKVVSSLEHDIFNCHGSQLFVAIGSVAVSAAEVANNGKRTLSSIWGELFKLRDTKKNCRYAEAMRHDYDSFFLPQKIVGDKRDVITGEDFAAGGEKPLSFPEGGWISPVNQAQIEIGKALRDADALIVSDKPVDFLKENAHIQPAHIGSYYYLAKIKDIQTNIADIHELGGGVTMILLNGIDMKTDYVLQPYMTYNICSMQFYGGNRFNGNTFEEMCDNDSFSRLGVLRMDVDNLGSIFQGGIPKEKASLARYAALSRSFDYFFSGYLNSICLTGERADSSFIIYSGGDDVFIVGSWETTIDIAEQIQADFRRYTCYNPAFSISGGVAILKAKFPIIAGAEESAEEEERAKDHDCEGKRKNSISFLATPLNWQYEFPAVKHLKERLVSLLETGKLPKAFLSLVIDNALDAGFRSHKPTHYKFYWRLAYNVKRMKERYKTPDALALLDLCVNEICHSNGKLGGENIETTYHALELWAFACRWAELQYRTNNN